MRKVLHIAAPRANYQCDAATISCFDSRFQKSFERHFEKLGIRLADPIKVAGGAKALCSPNDEAEREFMLSQIRTSVRLHQTRLVILTLHSDCGAYGGLAGAFGGDPRLEAQRQEEELRCAAKNLQAAIPGIEVQAYFADFEGIWEVELPEEHVLSGAGHV
jgi:carbonic anhydrase